jgi:hypothetical protein
MTEEQAEVTESNNTSSAEASVDSNESHQEAPQTQQEDRVQPAAAVDLNGLPPELAEPIKKRMDWLYYQTKDSKRQFNELKSIAQQQAELIEELRNNQTAVVGHLQEEKFSATESALVQKMQSAWETGDMQGYLNAQNQLTELKVEKKLSQLQKPQQQKQEKQAPQQNISGREIADDAFAGGEISPEENAYAQAWMSETDENGNLLRPWATGNDQKSQYALMEAAAVLNPDGPYAKWPMEKKLAEIDRRMGLQKNNVGSQPVLGANLTNRQKSNTITLSPKQREIAIRTKFGSNKGAKSEADYIAAFKKQIEQTRKGVK